MNDFNKQDLADILYCLKKRRDGLCDYIRFMNEVIKDNSSERIELLNNTIMSANSEIDRINFLIIKLEKEL